MSPGSVSEFAAGGRLRPKQRRLLHRVGCPNFRPSSLVLPSRRFPNLHAISGPPAGRRHGPIRVVLYDRRSAHQYGAAIFITYHPISKTDTHAFLTSRLIYIVLPCSMTSLCPHADSLCPQVLSLVCRVASCSISSSSLSSRQCRSTSAARLQPMDR